VTVDQLVDLFLVVGLLGSKLLLEVKDLMLERADGLVQLLEGLLLSLELLAVRFRSIAL
jgi:hypothetical protein